MGRLVNLLMISGNDFTNSKSYTIDTSKFGSIDIVLGAHLLSEINKHYSKGYSQIQRGCL